MNRRGFLKSMGLAGLVGVASMIPWKSAVVNEPENIVPDAEPHFVYENTEHGQWDNEVLTDADITRQALTAFHDRLEFAKQISKEYDRTQFSRFLRLKA